MNTRICPNCLQEKNTQGFHFHVRACKEENDPLRERYALQLANMRPEQAEKFLRKARGG